MTTSPVAADSAADSMPLGVLYRDDYLVVVSKPSGLLMHRDELHPDAPAALQTVRDQVGQLVYPVQRLDRGTSGILVFALASKIAARLQEALGEAQTRKEYLALVRWPGAQPELGDNWSNQRPLQDHKEVARSARTDFALVEVLHRCALVRATLHSGRFHQIRRHLNHDGRHVFGDTSHGKGRNNALYRERYGLWRLFLHMHHLVVRHPVTDVVLDLTDPLPAELQGVVQALRADRESARVRIDSKS